ncbi:MAG: M48 family metalloprotease [Bacteroidota bacterium]
MLRLRYAFFHLCFLLVLAVSGCREAPGGTVVGQSKQECTPEEAVLIGAKLQETIRNSPSDFPILDASAYAAELEYLNTLLSTLANTGPVLNRSNFSWDIQILNDDHKKNLFATPGGHFYITTGLLKIITNETELLGILGHEIMYADRDHIAQALIRKFGGDRLGSILLGEDVPEIQEMALSLQDLRYSESTVLQADSFAVELICPFLYDPLGMQSFLERLADSGPDELQVAWFDNRQTENLQNRIEQIGIQARDCGDFGKEFEERYQDFQAKLPQ